MENQKIKSCYLSNSKRRRKIQEIEEKKFATPKCGWMRSSNLKSIGYTYN